MVRLISGPRPHAGLMSSSFTKLLSCLILALAADVSAQTPSPSATNQSEKSVSPGPGASNANTAEAPLDACSLLTGQEIEAAQGAAPRETKPTERSQGGLSVSQCYFLLPTAADSIVLIVTRRATTPDARDPKQSWKEIFHGDHENMKEPDEEKKRAKPENISGLGDEAFWTVDRVAGVLYVLKGNCYIRISVGGAGDQASKLQKSKSLGEMVLKRL
jgi:hypothetical protein